MVKMNKIARQMKAVQHTQALAQGATQQSKASGLYLLALRSHNAELHSHLPTRKLVIKVYPQNQPEGRPVSVKITHL